MRAKPLARCLALFLLGPVKLLLLAGYCVGITLACIGVIFLFPPAVELARSQANLSRRLARSWSGVAIPEPYRPRPEAPEAGPNGLYPSVDGTNFVSSRGWATFQRRSRWIWTDPATWRDMLWLLADPVIGGVLTAVPPALLFGGAYLAAERWHGTLGIALGVVGAVLGWFLGSVMLKVHGYWTRVLLRPASASAVLRGMARRRWFGAGILGVYRCLAFALLGLAAPPLVAACAVAFIFTGPNVAMRVVLWARWLPSLYRTLGREWCGADLPEPYLPAPKTPAMSLPPDAAAAWWASFSRRSRSLWMDPATWRDMAFLLAQPLAGSIPLLVPIAFIGYGGWGLAFPGMTTVFGSKTGPFYGELFGSVGLGIAVGVVLFLVGVDLGPRLVRLHARWLPVLLSPTDNARLIVEHEQLAARVERLTETRTAATDAQAAELRRIERDLHDGAQARLVAMGMTLGAVEALIDADPEQAKQLVRQVRDSSATALSELRNLVRGIHPPVLAERGLVDAIRALALDCPINVRVTARFYGQTDDPVESAAYFAVAELLTNAAKHAHAEKVWVELRHNVDRLHISVLDDGTGGADIGKGTGLRGIERRLATFDGKVTVSSPPGGPTMVTMELPCVLSSPRTCTSSETD